MVGAIFLTMTTTTILYRYFDVNNNLLYVGISLHFFMRLKQHKYTSEWFASVTNITLERFSNRKEAENAERNAILTERPIHNVQHNIVKQTPIRVFREIDGLSGMIHACKKTYTSLWKEENPEDTFTVLDFACKFYVSEYTAKKIIKSENLSATIVNRRWILSGAIINSFIKSLHHKLREQNKTEIKQFAAMQSTYPKSFRVKHKSRKKHESIRSIVY